MKIRVRNTTRGLRWRPHLRLTLEGTGFFWSSHIMISPKFVVFQNFQIYFFYSPPKMPPFRYLASPDSAFSRYLVILGHSPKARLRRDKTRLIICACRTVGFNRSRRLRGKNLHNFVSKKSRIDKLFAKLQHKVRGIFVRDEILENYSQTQRICKGFHSINRCTD